MLISDLLEDIPPRLERNAADLPIKVWISAQSGIGIDLLRQAIIECLIYQNVGEKSDPFNHQMQDHWNPSLGCNNPLLN